MAALQVALREYGVYVGTVDGVRGPLTTAAVFRFQDRRGLVTDGVAGPRTRRALGPLGRPLLGQRWLAVGSVGWDVSVLEFRLRRWGLAHRAVDGRFDTRRAPRSVASRLHEASPPTASRGRRRCGPCPGLAPPAARLARTSSKPARASSRSRQRYRVSPWLLAKDNGLRLDRVIVPGQRLILPGGASASAAGEPTDPAAVRFAIDRWSSAYGVDPRLARALAWMESGSSRASSRPSVLSASCSCCPRPGRGST